MAEDLRPDFQLGENVLKTTEDQATGLVQLSENVIAGEALVVDGVNNDGQETVSTISSLLDDVKYLAMEPGNKDEMARVLHKGRTKVTFGGSFAEGARLEFNTDSQVISATSTKYVKASAVDPSSAALDAGFIDFDGSLTAVGVASSSS